MPIELIIEIEQSEYREDLLKHDNAYQWEYSENMVRIEEVTQFGTLKTGGLSIELTTQDTKLKIPGTHKVASPAIEVISGAVYQSD